MSPLSSRSSTLTVLASATRLGTPCGDGELVWHAWGSVDSPLVPLVLLHGGSGSWTHWVRNVEVLAASGRYVLVPDMPGFGDSALPPDGADADALPQPLQAGLDRLVGARPCVLVGFSFGGLTAGLLAARYPQRVSALVVVGAPALGLASRRLPGLKAWRHLKDEQERRAIHRFNLGALMLLHPESIDEQAVDIQAANVPRDRLPGRRLAFTRALAEALQDIRCPVHAVYGWEDALYQGCQALLEQTVRAASPSLQRFKFIDDAGHWVHYERAEAFNSVLLDILSL